MHINIEVTVTGLPNGETWYIKRDALSVVIDEKEHSTAITILHANSVGKRVPICDGQLSLTCERLE